MNQEMIINVYWLDKRNLKIKFMLKYFYPLTIEWLIQKQEVIGGLAHVPVLIFIANFIRISLGLKWRSKKYCS